METIKRKVKSGTEYEHLFPKAKGRTTVIRRDANVGHTVDFIPKAVAKTLYQTAHIAPLLKGKDVYETCRKVWQFAYDHITYEKDAHGVEQIRSPARTWADRQTGVDCDCYTTFICSILANLKIKGVTLRITKYKEDRFQHIYPIVKTENGRYITLDCVVHRFDYEEPYTEKKDKKMDLEFLDGLEENDNFESTKSMDDFSEDFGELGKGKLKNFFQNAGNKIKTATSSVKNVVHTINRVNPATVLLRNGLLAAMKINMMKVAGKLRWAYLNQQQAKAKGITPDRYQKLKAVLQKLEKIFYGAGGKPENLKKAILTGKGNQNKDVLAGFSGHYESIPLETLLGADIYHSENGSGLGTLGEPVSTGAAIVAATGAVAALAVSIKNVGDLFPKGSKLNDSGNEEDSASRLPSKIDLDEPKLPANSIQDKSGITEDDNEEQKGENFWDKNKSWMKPTLITVAGLTALGFGIKYLRPKSVSGLEGTRKSNTGKRKKQPKQKLTPVAIM